MKESTLKLVNKTMFNYLSLIGIWDEKNMNQDNPIILYFMTNTMLNRPDLLNPSEQGLSVIKLEEEGNQFTNVNITNQFFHQIVREFYNVYGKIDEIVSHQDERVKESLIQFIGSEQKFNDYITDIKEEYKNSFYELLRNFNSPNPNYNEIKIKVLNDKMMECAYKEDYKEAAILRDKINLLKEKGKI